MSYLEFIKKEVGNWKEKSLLRTLRYEPDLIDFSSNDYLCLNKDGSHGALLQSLTDATGAFANSGSGTNVTVGSTGSRLIRGHWPSFEEAESQFNQWTEVPSSLLFQSGYSANVGALSALTGPGDVAFCDRLCHASLLDGIRLSGAQKQYYDHNDLDHLESLLRKKPCKRRRWILCEGVFSMDGDTPDLDGLLQLCKRYDATLYLDEAHSLGYYGSERSPGAGLVASHREKLDSDLFSYLVISAPLGKAPGIMGAFVAGDALLKEFLVNRARSFVFSTAQPPLLAAMISRILENFRTHKYDERISKLRSNASYFRERVEQLGLGLNSQSAIVPVVLGQAETCLETSESLKSMGMDVRAIRPPTVAEGSSRLRITVHSCHTQKQLDRLLQGILQKVPSDQTV